MNSRKPWLVLLAPLSVASCHMSGYTAEPDDGGAPADVGDAGPNATSDGGAPAPAAVICTDYDKYKHVYFGDLHTHTSYSADAFGFATRNQPSDAWAFARGTPVQVAQAAPMPGPKVTISHNLDFDAITDHSEWIAASYACGVDSAGNPLDPSHPLGAACDSFTLLGNSGVKAIPGAAQALKDGCGEATEDVGKCLPIAQSAWQAEQQMANAANMPCTFTALIGYEWTSADPKNKATLHKNVVFSSEHVPDRPFDSLDYKAPTDLWTALDDWQAADPACADGSCAALTIPHNSNKSWGEAFVVPSTATGADQMRRYQKLVEIHQHKGNSECFYDPTNPAGDATCNFEHLTPGDNGPLDLEPKNYVRRALEDGLIAYAANGKDPLQLGIVGATDDHNGMPGSVAEDNWHGHTGIDDYGAMERLQRSIDKNPGGITGVWAEQNTRQSIFDALSRRETFATSGVFMAVRFYQSWSNTDFCNAGFPKNAIDDGAVAMGGTMTAGAGKPWLYVSAMKDVADIERVDLVKGTLINGQVVETVTPLAAPSPGAFCMRWQDASFDPKAPTFYYARVLQVPTPRWSHYDCLKQPTTAGCGPGGGLDVNIQERAWTSPIWSLP